MGDGAHVFKNALKIDQKHTFKRRKRLSIYTKGNYSGSFNLITDKKCLWSH